MMFDDLFGNRREGRGMPSDEDIDELAKKIEGNDAARADIADNAAKLLTMLLAWKAGDIPTHIMELALEIPEEELNLLVDKAVETGEHIVMNITLGNVIRRVQDDNGVPGDADSESGDDTLLR